MVGTTPPRPQPGRTPQCRGKPQGARPDIPDVSRTPAAPGYRSEQSPRREPAMHIHDSRAREPGSPCPGPSPIGSASRRQPTCRGTEVRTRMAIGANSLNFAALRLPAGPALRAATRGSGPAIKRMRSLNDQFQAYPREASTMAMICKGPRADDGAPVPGRGVAKYPRVCRGPGGTQAPNAVGTGGCPRVLRSPGRDASRAPACHGRLGGGS